MKSPRVSNVSLLLLIFVSVFACVASRAFSSPPPQGQGTNFNLEGKITDEAPGKLTMQMEGNIIMHVTYDAKTAIHRRDGSQGSSKDLKPGAVVKVEGDLDSSGVVRANRIDLE
jgi:hypothetical protein